MSQNNNDQFQNQDEYIQETQTYKYNGLVMDVPQDCSSIADIEKRRSYNINDTNQMFNHLRDDLIYCIENKMFNNVLSILDMINELFKLNTDKIGYQSNISQIWLKIDQIFDSYGKSAELNQQIKERFERIKVQVNQNINTQQQARSFAIQTNITQTMPFQTHTKKGEIELKVPNVIFTFTFDEEDYLLDITDLIKQDINGATTRNQFQLYGGLIEILYYLAYYGESIYNQLEQYWQKLRKRDYYKKFNVTVMHEQYRKFMTRVSEKAKEYYNNKKEIEKVCNQYINLEAKDEQYNSQINIYYQKIEKYKTYVYYNSIYNILSDQQKQCITQITQKGEAIQNQQRELQKQVERELKEKLRQELMQQQQLQQQTQQQAQQQVILQQQGQQDQQQQNQQQVTQEQDQQQNQQQEYEIIHQQDNLSLINDIGNENDVGYDYMHENNQIDNYTQENNESHSNHDNIIQVNHTERPITSEVKQQRPHQYYSNKTERQIQQEIDRINRKNIRKAILEAQQQEQQENQNTNIQQQIKKFIINKKDDTRKILFDSIEVNNNNVKLLDTRLSNIEKTQKEQSATNEEYRQYQQSTKAVYQSIKDLFMQQQKWTQEDMKKLEEEVKKQQK